MRKLCLLVQNIATQFAPSMVTLTKPQVWQNPSTNSLAISCDVLWVTASKPEGVCAACRNRKGAILDGVTIKRLSYSLLVAEAKGLHLAIQFADKFDSSTPIRIDFDANEILLAMKDTSAYPWEIHSLILDSYKLLCSMPNMVLSCVARKANMLAGFLSK